MLLNRLEFALMNNPIRAAVQRSVEARALLALGGRMNGGAALELGCGSGVGTRLILDRFGATSVDAFDLDLRMVRRTRARLGQQRHPVRLWTGDASAVAAPDACYDAVFDFAILHHVPDWRAALGEVYRVLKPGGRFYAEEALRSLIDHPVARWALRHPVHDRFDQREFVDGLTQAGLRPRATRCWRNVFAWFVADRPAA